MSSHSDVNTKRALHELLMLVPDGNRVMVQYGWRPRIVVDLDRTSSDGGEVSVSRWIDSSSIILYSFNAKTKKCTYFNVEVDSGDDPISIRKLFENYSSIFDKVVQVVKKIPQVRSLEDLAKNGLMEVGVIDLPSTDDTPDPVE